MDLEKLTSTMQQALGDAREIAITRHNQDIDIVHLWKIFLTPDHFARGLYQDLGLNMNQFEQKVDAELDRYPSIEGGNVQYGQGLSQNLYNLLIEADKIRESFKDEYTSTETVVLGLMKLKNYSLTKYLKEQGITEKALKEEIEKMRGGERVTSQNQEEQYQALEKYGTDLVQAVKSGKQDPVIGRDEEIRDVISDSIS